MGNNLTLQAETGGQGGECPIQEMSECPSNAGVGPDGGEVDPRNMMPPPNQRPAPNQPFPLPIERQKSTIPKAGTEETWTYPSQQMFFNALLRKGENKLGLQSHTRIGLGLGCGLELRLGLGWGRVGVGLESG